MRSPHFTSQILWHVWLGIWGYHSFESTDLCAKTRQSSIFHQLHSSVVLYTDNLWVLWALDYVKLSNTGKKENKLFTYRRVFTVNCNINNVWSTIGFCTYFSRKGLLHWRQDLCPSFGLRLVRLHEQRPGFQAGTELQAWLNGRVLGRVRHSLISFISCTIHLDFYLED